MTTLTITSIIIAGIILSFFGSLLAAAYKKRRVHLFFRILIGLCWVLFLLVTLYGDHIYFYHQGQDDQLSKRYKLPFIDSTMLLSELDGDERVYVTTSNKWNDSTAFHLKKEIRTNVFGVYQIDDEFVNRKERSALIWSFRTPGIFRDSNSIFHILTGDINHRKNDTISRSQAISVLKDWKIYDQAFEEYHGLY